MRLLVDTPQILAKFDNDQLLHESGINELTAQAAVRAFCQEMRKLLAPINTLTLSVRATRVCERAGLKTILDLKTKRPLEIANLRNSGIMVRAEIKREVFNTYNVKLDNWDEGIVYKAIRGVKGA